VKLSETRIDKALTQLTAQAVPENHPVMGQLSEIFGDHTFFIDAGGLNIIEPPQSEGAGPGTGEVVKLARWFDETRTNLVPQEPEYTALMIELDRAA
jgi:hypothetical protein